MKQIKKIGILTCLLAVTTIHAQDFEWAKSIGSTSNDEGLSNSVDALGNVYTTGAFQGTVDFDPGAGTFNLTSEGSFDIFVQKMDPSGNLLWAKSFGGNDGDVSNAIRIDASGNVYTVGLFRATVDFDPGAGIFNLTSAGFYDAFVQKMDPSGNFIWAKSFGGSSYDNGKSICIDDLGNVYATGFFTGMVDFDPGAATFNMTSSGSEDIFVQKMDASGNFLWAKSFGGSSNDIGNVISVDDLGNVHTTGAFQGVVDFDPGAGTANMTSQGSKDIFVQKMDASGNFLWVKSFGGSSNDNGNAISVDNLGNVYTTGSFEETVDFDPGAGTFNMTSVGNTDVFVQKMDPTGNFLWAKSFGSTISNASGTSITVDTLGNIYTTGYFQDTVDFNPGVGTNNITAVGSSDIFVHKMNATGNFIWAKSFGGSSNDIGNSISVDDIGNVYTTGYFRETVDFDPGAGTLNMTSAGIYDVFVQKMSQCIATNTDVQTACDSYTWIDGNTYTASNNTATHILTNAAGCDSVVTLNLNINSVSDITTSLSGLTIIATNTNASYQWLDCDNNDSAINNETNQTFTANENGNYAVELTENGCVDTTNCVAITTAGIMENTFGDDLVVYPNPTNGNFSVDLGEKYAHIKINITDINGSLIQSSEYKNSQILNLSITEPKGIYLMIIESAEQRTVIQLVKQ
jgi:hypothetical protein